MYKKNHSGAGVALLRKVDVYFVALVSSVTQVFKRKAGVLFFAGVEKQKKKNAGTNEFGHNRMFGQR
jgi:hypothetical protein